MDGGAEIASTVPRDRFRQVFRRIADRCDLPPLPQVAARAMAIAQDPTAQLRDVARIVAGDAAMAARLLRIASSPMYARRRPQNLEQALHTVGLGALRTLLVAAGASTAYLGRGPDAQRLWEHALATAVAADEIGALAGIPRGGAPFIAGLLHDVGRLVFLVGDRVAYAGLGTLDAEAEQAAFGFTHPEAGGCLADLWGLDPSVVEAIMAHHVRPLGSLAGLSAAVARADAVACRIGLGAVESAGADAAGDEEPLLEDPHADVEAFLARVRTTFDETRGFFV